MRTATRNLWLVHLVATVVVLAGVYFWLGILDANGLQLTATALFGALLAAFAIWLEGAAFAYFRAPDQSLGRAYRNALRHLPSLALLAIVAVALYWGMGGLLDRAPSKAAMTASWFTLHLHRPVHPALILAIITGAIRVVEWFVIPVLLLPMAAAAADVGWRGLTPRSLTLLRRLTFLIACPLLLLIALYAPWRLIHWTPYQGKLGLEMTSFLGRWIVAWVLFVTAWLGVTAVSGGRFMRFRDEPPENPVS